MNISYKVTMSSIPQKMIDRIMSKFISTVKNKIPILYVDGENNIEMKCIDNKIYAYDISTETLLFVVEYKVNNDNKLEFQM